MFCVYSPTFDEMMEKKVSFLIKKLALSSLVFLSIIVFVVCQNKSLQLRIQLVLSPKCNRRIELDKILAPTKIVADFISDSGWIIVCPCLAGPVEPYHQHDHHLGLFVRCPTANSAASAASAARADAHDHVNGCNRS